MDIRETRKLTAFASQRLENARDAGKIVLIFSAITLGSAALVTLVNYLLSLQISRSGGLGNLGTRSTLSSVQTILPMLQTLLVRCLTVGYLAAMLRLARGQYASPHTLKLGFDRFWPLLRLTLIQGLIYTGIGFVSVYVSVMIFMITPLSRPHTLKLGFDRFWPLLRLTLIQGLIYTGIGFVSVYVSVMIFMITPLSRGVTELLLPLMQDASVLNPGFVLDDALYSQLTAAMAPVFVLCAVVFCAAAMPIFYQYRMAEYVLIDHPELGALLYSQLTAAMAPVFVLCAVVFCAAAMPIFYQYRMAEYVLIDHPELGALAVLRESRNMMRRNRINLFKLDLHLWWYYAAMILVNLLAYGDLLLGLFGISLPFSPDAAYYLFYVLYLAGTFALYYFLRSHVEVTYALAYDSLRPQQAPTSGAVLGNIFQM